MKACFLRPKLTMVFIFWLALAGCVTKPSAPTNFYMLTPLAPSATKPSTDASEIRTVIAVEAVEIPGYLDRNQIVTNLDDTEYELADFDQWAESVGDNLTRVITENLSRLLAADSADVFSLAKSIPYDYSIAIDVMRLDGRLGDQVVLVARWAIFGTDEDDLILLRKSKYQQTVSEDTYKGLVLAQSRAVENLSQDIAKAIKKTLSNVKRKE